MRYDCVDCEAQAIKNIILIEYQSFGDTTWHTYQNGDSIATGIAFDGIDVAVVDLTENPIVA